MKSLYTCIDESLDDAIKLSPDDKKYLLELDAQYQKILQGK